MTLYGFGRFGVPFIDLAVHAPVAHPERAGDVADHGLGGPEAAQDVLSRCRRHLTRPAAASGVTKEN